jgi:hypothetical protein
MLLKRFLIHELKDSLPCLKAKMVVTTGADFQVGFQRGDKNPFFTFFAFDPEILISSNLFRANSGFEFIYP